MCEKVTTIASDCEENQYFNEEECYFCDSNCLTCDGPSKVDCLSCDENLNMELYHGECVCTEGFVEITDNDDSDETSECENG